MQVLSIVPDGSQSYHLSNFDKQNPNNFSFTMNMKMNVSVVNNNYYHLKVNNIALTTYIRANMSAINSQTPSPAGAILQADDSKRVFVNNGNLQQPIGSGAFGAINFPRGQNITFSMNLLVSYSPNKALGAINDPGNSHFYFSI